MMSLSAAAWARWNGEDMRSARSPGSCRASHKLTTSPLATISMMKIQACGHRQVPAATNSSTAVTA